MIGVVSVSRDLLVGDKRYFAKKENVGNLRVLNFTSMRLKRHRDFRLKGETSTQVNGRFFRFRKMAGNGCVKQFLKCFRYYRVVCTCTGFGLFVSSFDD
jgi:hypothetical protein